MTNAARDNALVFDFDGLVLDTESASYESWQWAFAEAGADTLLLEIGLGGRLDAVNAVEPTAGLITNIGLDHTEFAGPTLADIAREKAGILRRGVPAWSSADGAGAEALAARAADVGAPVERGQQLV